MQCFKQLNLILALTYAAAWGSTSEAASICKDNAQAIRQLYSCTGDRWTKDECFNIALACGEYELITANTASKVEGKTENELYWEGMAYYGLLTRTRSSGIRCEYLSQSRRTLSQYLKIALAALNRTYKENFLYRPDPDQVMRATKILRELGKISGCPEDGLTLTEVEKIAEEKASKSVQDAFLRPTEIQKVEMAKIFKEIQQVVTDAAAVETNIGLKSIAVDTINFYLNGPILSDWNSIGIVTANSSQFSVNNVTAVKRRDEDAKPLLKAAYDLSAALTQALEGCKVSELPHESTPEKLGLTAAQWAALSPAQKEEKDKEKVKRQCAEQAAYAYAEASDSQKIAASIELKRGNLATMVNGHGYTGAFDAFQIGTSPEKVSGVTPLNLTVASVARSWIKFGTEVRGFDSFCQRNNNKYWFCVTNPGTGAR